MKYEGGMPSRDASFGTFFSLEMGFLGKFEQLTVFLGAKIGGMGYWGKPPNR